MKLNEEEREILVEALETYLTTKRNEYKELSHKGLKYWTINRLNVVEQLLERIKRL